MEYFNDPEFIFLHGKKLDFNWIEKEGHHIEVLADDLTELALKNCMDNHEPEPEIND